MRACGWVLVGACLVGCGGGTVPTLTPTDLASPRMQGMEPRTLAIEVKDNRPIAAEDRKATEKNVARGLTEVFAREGIKVTAESPNILTVRLERPASGVKDIDPESCVEMLGELKLGDGRSMSATTLGCAEYQNAFGMSYGLNVDGAFQYAASALLNYLDQGYKGANSPLTFVSASIEVPKFPEVGVTAIRLAVKDEYSEDGSLGRNLTEELTGAFAGAGVRIDEKVGQSMKLTLSHPTEDFAGRDKSTCMVIAIEARLERGTAFGHGTSCRGVAETGHHKVLSDTLKALWTEYARPLEKE
jgi:hypothetical protein